MALRNKALNSFLSLTLAMGLLPCSAFANTEKTASEIENGSVFEGEGSEFADGGVAAKPEYPTIDLDEQSANKEVKDDTGTSPMDDDECGSDPGFFQPDYENGKLAIWADGLDDPSDVMDVYPPDTNEIELYASRSNLTPMTFSDEMLYFCKYESSCNYDQGLSSGDGYHAMGYFQFDNRYGLGSFLKAVYDYNPSKYAALKVIGDRYKWNVSGATRENGAFTQLGNDLNAAWHAAYKANPDEFSRLQNGWAYKEYYSGALGARECLYAFGINLDNRPDCVKGLCWGMVNLFGAGGGASYIDSGLYYGANWFFKYSGINNSMSDTALVTTLCDFVIDNVSKRYPKQSIYWNGWQNRYRSEKKDCLNYLKTDYWVNNGGRWWYRHADGSYTRNDWEAIDGRWYHFDASGWMQTGWLNMGGTWYYLDGSGAMLTGWYKVGSTWYYSGGSGAMLTGWQQIGGTWYYLGGNGAMRTGWLNMGGTWYYLNGSGAMLTGWQQIGGTWYYLGGNGAMKTGWYRVGGSWYYSNPNGVMRHSTWIGDYYLLDDGHMATNRWVGPYYVGSDGRWVR